MFTLIQMTIKRIVESATEELFDDSQSPKVEYKDDFVVVTLPNKIKCYHYWYGHTYNYDKLL